MLKSCKINNCETKLTVVNDSYKKSNTDFKPNLATEKCVSSSASGSSVNNNRNMHNQSSALSFGDHIKDSFITFKKIEESGIEEKKNGLFLGKTNITLKTNVSAIIMENSEGESD